jgi:hypothetical protein
MSKIKLPHSSGNSMAIAAPATNPASDLELKLPATIGTANQILKNSGTAGTLEYATATESSGNFAINSGYGSVTTTFGVRAWVTFEGNSGSGDDTSVTVNGSGGVTSVTRVSSSLFQVNLSFTMPDTNYSWTAVARRDNEVANSFDVVSWFPSDSKNTTNFRFRTFYVSGTGGVGSHNGRVVQVMVVR